jgi:hypothetical protein
MLGTVMIMTAETIVGYIEGLLDARLGQTVCASDQATRQHE